MNNCAKSYLCHESADADAGSFPITKEIRQLQKSQLDTDPSSKK